MVLALLAGTKTQTRRLVKPQPPKSWNFHKMNGNIARFFFNPISWGFIKCPYGQVGDVIWVRETFLDATDFACSDYDPEDPESGERYSFKADCPADQWTVYTWKPSLFMPKEACRIWLEITDIRVERLNEISEEDALAEGVEYAEFATTDDGIDMGFDEVRFRNYALTNWPHSENTAFPALTAKGSYQTLWNKINGPGSWSANPFVWCISFKQTSKPQLP